MGTEKTHTASHQGGVLSSRGRSFSHLALETLPRPRGAPEPNPHPPAAFHSWLTAQATGQGGEGRKAGAASPAPHSHHCPDEAAALGTAPGSGVFTLAVTVPCA